MIGLDFTFNFLNFIKIFKPMKYILFALSILISCFSFSQSIEPNILLGNPSERANLEDEAVRFYTIRLDNNPTDVKALMLRSELYRAMNHPTLAENDMRAALSLNPYARIYLHNDYRKQLFPIKKYSYLSDYNINLDHTFEKSFILVELYLELLDHVDKEGSSENLSMALKSLIEKDFDDSALYLDKVQPDVKNTALYNDIKGMLMLERGNAEESIKFFSLAIKQEPNLVTPYHNRAIAYKAMGELENAEKDFISALQINNEVAKIHFGKGKLMELKGDSNSAAYFYKNAIDKSSFYPEASLNYSSLLKSEGEYTKAMIQINKAMDESPDAIENYYVRGGLYFIYGEFDNAIDDFDTYISYNNEDNEALFYRGLSKVMSEELSDGCQDLKESITNGYNHENVKIVLYMCND